MATTAEVKALRHIGNIYKHVEMMRDAYDRSPEDIIAFNVVLEHLTEAYERIDKKFNPDMKDILPSDAYPLSDQPVAWIALKTMQLQSLFYNTNGITNFNDTVHIYDNANDGIKVWLQREYCEHAELIAEYPNK